MHVRFSRGRALGRAATAVIVIALLVLGGASVYFYASSGAVKSSTTTGSGTTTTSAHAVPQSITYETLSTVQFLDPQVSYDIYGASVEQNVYEPLLWFNGSNGRDPIPWLAQSYQVSTDGKTLTATLRSGIKFADGETLNSSAVYFSYNRLLVMDGSAPVGHGTQASWIMQQLLDTSLSTTLCSCTQTYGSQYTQKVLNEHFVQTTGPLTLVLHIMNPNSALPYLSLISGQT